MKIRFGTYTLYKNIEISVEEYYGHGLDQELEKNHRILSYSNEHMQLDGFVLDEVSNKFKKDILIKDLENAFFVITKAKYKGEIFEVKPYYGDEIHLHLATKNLELGKKLNFYELHDGYGIPYYLGEIKIWEIDKLWEEYTTSSLNLPMPKDFPKERIIEIQRDIQ